MYLLGLAGSVIFYAAYQEWFSWILLLTCVGLPWVSLLLSLRAMFTIWLEASAARRIPLGSGEKLQIRCRSRLPQPPHRCRFRVTRPITGERWTLKPGDSLPTEHCGGLVVSLHRAYVCDYLGLFRRRIRNAEPRTFLVLPEPVAMDIPADLESMLARSLRPKPGGGYSEHHEIRSYHPGDNLNQIHWKLSAKVGELMLREPMEPERGLMLLTMDLSGPSEVLDRKFGQLLWLGQWLLSQSISFEVRALTGKGIECWKVQDEWSMKRCVEELLCRPFAPEGSIQHREFRGTWRCHIGGDGHEA